MAKADAALVAAALAAAPNARELLGDMAAQSSAAPLTAGDIVTTDGAAVADAPDFDVENEDADYESEDNTGDTVLPDGDADAPTAPAAVDAVPTYTPEQIANWQRAEQIERLAMNDPAALIALLTQHNPALATTAQPVAADPYVVPAEELSQLTIPERIAYDNKEFITRGPQRVGQIEQFVQQQQSHVNQAFTWRDYLIEVQQAQVSALADMLGIELPAPDPNVIDALMKSGKDLKTAVAEGYGKKAKEHVALKKAQAKPQPRTPSSGGGDTVPLHPDKLPANASLREQIAAEQALKRAKR